MAEGLVEILKPTLYKGKHMHDFKPSYMQQTMMFCSSSRRSWQNPIGKDDLENSFHSCSVWISLCELFLAHEIFEYF